MSPEINALDVSQLFSVRNKKILITGGTRGIGFMLARGFLLNGAQVYVAARSSEACAQAESMLSQLGTCRAFVVDLSKEEGIDYIARSLERETDRIDVLINNAGTVALHPFGEFPSRGWDDVIALNVRAPFMLTQALMPLLEKAATHKNPSRVINIGSIAALVHNAEGTFSYCASKAALAQLSRTLAHELAPRRITVNVLAPGSVHTEMFEQNASVEEHQARNPLGRLGRESDLVGAAIYLASPAGAWVTGSTVTVDGGMLIG